MLFRQDLKKQYFWIDKHFIKCHYTLNFWVKISAKIIKTRYCIILLKPLQLIVSHSVQISESLISTKSLINLTDWNYKFERVTVNIEDPLSVLESVSRKGLKYSHFKTSGMKQPFSRLSPFTSTCQRSVEKKEYSIRGRLGLYRKFLLITVIFIHLELFMLRTINPRQKGLNLIRNLMGFIETLTFAKQVLSNKNSRPVFNHSNCKIP